MYHNNDKKCSAPDELSAAVHMFLNCAKLRNVLQKFPDIPKQTTTWKSKKIKETAEPTR
jgi:hypothetical protein